MYISLELLFLIFFYFLAGISFYIYFNINFAKRIYNNISSNINFGGVTSGFYDDKNFRTPYQQFKNYIKIKKYIEKKKLELDVEIVICNKRTGTSYSRVNGEDIIFLDAKEIVTYGYNSTLMTLYHEIGHYKNNDIEKRRFMKLNMAFFCGSTVLFSSIVSSTVLMLVMIGAILVFVQFYQNLYFRLKEYRADKYVAKNKSYNIPKDGLKMIKELDGHLDNRLNILYGKHPAPKNRIHMMNYYYHE